MRREQMTERRRRYREGESRHIGSMWNEGALMAELRNKNESGGCGCLIHRLISPLWYWATQSKQD